MKCSVILEMNELRRSNELVFILVNVFLLPLNSLTLLNRAKQLNLFIIGSVPKTCLGLFVYTSRDLASLQWHIRKG